MEYSSRNLLLAFLSMFLLQLRMTTAFEPDDFPFENGQNCRDAKVDLVLVLDSSGSVERTFENYKAVARHIVQLLPIGYDRTLMSILQYSKEAHVLLPFSADQRSEQLNEIVEQIQFLGSITATAEAVQMGLAQFGCGTRSDASKVFILITDGNSNNKWSDVVNAANALQSSGATVAVVAFGDSIYWPEIDLYAGSNTNAYTEQNVEHLYGLLMDLTGRVCEEQSTEHCSQQADIIIVVDSSQSVEEQFEQYKAEALELVRSLDVGINSTLCSIVQYGRHATVILPFSEHQSKEIVIDSLQNLKHLGGTTHTADAIQLALHQLKLNGRSRSKKLFLLMTDGNSADSWDTVLLTADHLHASIDQLTIVAFGSNLGYNELQAYGKQTATVLYNKDTGTLNSQMAEHLQCDRFQLLL
ncbi:Collagen alpha-6(VI) chain [Trichinella papuae]|uniref:Collagen alpha-6(VI) chain n=1 Tax=Trichinella papuae TaxID=268474 RepID=A0A0V1MLU8_9BILA|nr:Collagen alpha-6(VI) chain [Trichinella papuae]